MAGPDSPTFRVTLAQTQESFACPAEQTVLQAALAAGFGFASSCRNGTCRTCIRQLASGSVRYDVEWPGLTPEEKREGYFLPCVAMPTSDLVISPESTKPWWES